MGKRKSTNQEIINNELMDGIFIGEEFSDEDFLSDEVFEDDELPFWDDEFFEDAKKAKSAKKTKSANKTRLAKEDIRNALYSDVFVDRNKRIRISPKEIKEKVLDKHIYGQEMAKKKAAIFVRDHSKMLPEAFRVNCFPL